jgi:3-methyladenine DNA glycosylase/8-oxoguanine DNA glycosylase
MAALKQTERAAFQLGPFDLERTFALHRFGLYDPTSAWSRVARGVTVRKAFVGPQGPCIVELGPTDDGFTVDATGPDASAVLGEFTESVRVDDGYGAFAPEHALLAKLHRALTGMRLVRVPWRFDVAACTVLQQRVTVREAWQQWSRIAKRYGDPIGGLRAFPSAERVAHMESWRFEQLGVDPKRTRAMIGLARDSCRRGMFAWTDVARVRRHMRANRGIGPWTTEMTLGFAYGDPDALPLADLHLPHLVTWALARERPGSDERMVELLEPYRGHRFRAVRLLLAAGIARPR